MPRRLVAKSLRGTRQAIGTGRCSRLELARDRMSDPPATAFLRICLWQPQSVPKADSSTRAACGCRHCGSAQTPNSKMTTYPRSCLNLAIVKSVSCKISSASVSFRHMRARQSAEWKGQRLPAAVPWRLSLRTWRVQSTLASLPHYSAIGNSAKTRHHRFRAWRDTW